MGLLTKQIDTEDFKGKIHILTCEVTGKKLANILIRKDNSELQEDIFTSVKAISPFADNSDSGIHTIGGIIAIGPVDIEESPRFATEILDIVYDDDNGVELMTIYVKPKKDNKNAVKTTIH